MWNPVITPHLYRTVFDEATNGIMITGADNNILAVNRAFTDITGYTPDEVVGKHPRLLSRREGTAFYQEPWASPGVSGRWQGEVWNRRKDGALYAAWLSISAVCDEEGAVTHHVAVFSELTERLLCAEKVRCLAYHDPLTGLPNRALLYDRINRLLLQARREQRPVAVLFVDLDYFKDVNELFGYAAGDLLLQAVAERLQDCVREVDTVARLDGDGFVVVSALRRAADAPEVAQKIVTALARPFLIHERELYLSASVGVSLSPYDGEDAETLIIAADLTMYQAKQEGGGYRLRSARALEQASEETVPVERIPAFLMSEDRGLKTERQSGY
jgi:diguanylate cyclase (GGDEF)-like protein/PAS domain S-box-containing protein